MTFKFCKAAAILWRADFVREGLKGPNNVVCGLGEIVDLTAIRNEAARLIRISEERHGLQCAGKNNVLDPPQGFKHLLGKVRKFGHMWQTGTPLESSGESFRE
jgi:hypothetical protein